MKLRRTTVRISVSVVAALVVGLLLVFSVTLMNGCKQRAAAADAQDGAAAQTVSIDNFSFTPMEITISPGTQVTWTNKDDVPHTVTSVDKRFKSQALDTDEKFSFTFKNPGSYEYFCSVHPKMIGKIIVR